MIQPIDGSGIAPDVRADVIRLLCSDALEATNENGAEAALLMMDAALSIAVTKLGPVGAHEMSGLLIGYLLQQGDRLIAPSA